VNALVWKWLKALAAPLLFDVVLLGIFWALGRSLPEFLWIKAGAGAAAAAVGVLHAQLVIDALFCTENVDFLEGLRLGWLLRLTPPEFNRFVIRLALVALWLVRSQFLIGTFVNLSIGGDLQARMHSNLNRLRSAAAVYRSAHRRVYPASLEGLVVSGSTVTIPTAWSSRTDYARRLLPHPESAQIEYYGNEACRGSTNATLSTVNLRDTGHWGYIRSPQSACWGQIFIDCTHTDFEGRSWLIY